MPGSPSNRSVNRRGPGTRSRTISNAHRCPTTSRAAARPQYCRYVRLLMAAIVQHADTTFQFE